LSSDRAPFAIRVAFSAATAILVLAGASLNVTGRTGGQAVILAIVAGVLALVAGVFNQDWKYSAPAGVAALVLSLLASGFDFRDPALPLQVGGLLLLGLGGYVGSVAYRSFTDALQRQLNELDALAGQLEDKHRAFLAATSDVEGPAAADITSLTHNIAQQTRATFGCSYLLSPDAKQFVPQPPGFGLDRLHPQPVNRVGAGSGPLLSAVEAGKEFVGDDKTGLTELVHYLPDDLRVDSLLAVPMKIGDHVGGFILLGNKPGGFTDDDLRLVTTLILRAGAQLASAHAVALSQKESERYTLMNELVKEASGKTQDEVLDLVLNKGRQLIRYDSGRIALFQPDDTYVFLGDSSITAPIEGALAKVREG